MSFPAIPLTSSSSPPSINCCLLILQDTASVRPHHVCLIDYYRVRLLSVFTAAGFIIRPIEIEQNRKHPATMLIHEKGGISINEWQRFKMEIDQIMEEFNSNPWKVFYGPNPSVVLFYNGMEKPCGEDFVKGPDEWETIVARTAESQTVRY
jgi:hypothetical protein